MPLAEDWRPSSAAISFVTDVEEVLCSFTGGTYAPIEHDGPPSWKRTAFEFENVELSRQAPAHERNLNGIPVSVGSRWRKLGDSFLVTVHVRLLTTSTESDRLDVPLMLFQVALSVAPTPGGTILEYERAAAFDADAETPELRLRYRDKRVFAVGHGMAADWELVDGRCKQVFLTPVPAFVVPAIEVSSFTEVLPNRLPSC